MLHLPFTRVEHNKGKRGSHLWMGVTGIKTCSDVFPLGLRYYNNAGKYSIFRVFAIPMGSNVRCLRPKSSRFLIVFVTEPPPLGKLTAL